MCVCVHGRHHVPLSATTVDKSNVWRNAKIDKCPPPRHVLPRSLQHSLENTEISLQCPSFLHVSFLKKPCRNFFPVYLTHSYIDIYCSSVLPLPHRQICSKRHFLPVSAPSPPGPPLQAGRPVGNNSIHHPSQCVHALLVPPAHLHPSRFYLVTSILDTSSVGLAFAKPQTGPHRAASTRHMVAALTNAARGSLGSSIPSNAQS